MLNKPPITKPIIKKVSNIKNNPIPPLNQSEIGLNEYKEHLVSKGWIREARKQPNKAFVREIKAWENHRHIEDRDCKGEDLDIEVGVCRAQRLNVEVRVWGYAPFHTGLARSSNCPPYHFRNFENSNQSATKSGKTYLRPLPFVQLGTNRPSPVLCPIFFQSCKPLLLSNRVKKPIFQPAENQGNKKSVTLAKSLF